MAKISVPGFYGCRKRYSTCKCVLRFKENLHLSVAAYRTSKATSSKNVYAFGPIAFCVPQGEGGRQLTTEPGDLPVDSYPSQNWDDSIFFLTFGGVEKHFEGVAHNSMFLAEN
jgi:hypothetical protein